MRAETFAEHLEHIQWHVRPVTLIPDTLPPLFPNLNVNESLFSQVEARKAIHRLASGKSIREDDVPIECFKALADEPGPAFQKFVDLLSHCYAHHHLPADWLRARVAVIFKKGNPASCDNYRPICLLATAYNIFGLISKQRLTEAGVEERLWKSQL